MLVRIVKLPYRGELDELDLRRFQTGETYDVTPQLGMLLIIGGYAELGRRFERSEAPDSRRAPGRKKPRK